jgi:hypothetical protein
MAAAAPSFLITIDTEGDDLWSCPRTITTRNSSYLPRFQELCERHGLAPTWLVNWEMARCPAFVDFGRDVLRRGTGEIGLHLHAWNSPPIVPLTDDDDRHQPYLIEYSDELLREKLKVLDAELRQAFSGPIRSHRAGRWAFDGRYARALLDLGYDIDCSVTPHVSWRRYKGDPRGRGGVDYRAFPEHAYWMDLDDLSRPGASRLLELPLTVMYHRGNPLLELLRRRLDDASLAGRALERFARSRSWLRPSGKNLDALLAILRRARTEGRPYVEFVLHSSELMPGGSPYFPDAAAIERLYEDLEALFAAARAGGFQGRTLAAHAELVPRPGAAAPHAAARRS